MYGNDTVMYTCKKFCKPFNNKSLCGLSDLIICMNISLHNTVVILSTLTTLDYANLCKLGTITNLHTAISR